MIWPMRMLNWLVAASKHHIALLSEPTIYSLYCVTNHGQNQTLSSTVSIYTTVKIKLELHIPFFAIFCLLCSSVNYFLYPPYPNVHFHFRCPHKSQMNFLFHIFPDTLWSTEVHSMCLTTRFSEACRISNSRNWGFSEAYRRLTSRTWRFSEARHCFIEQASQNTRVKRITLWDEKKIFLNRLENNWSVSIATWYTFESEQTGKYLMEIIIDTDRYHALQQN